MRSHLRRTSNSLQILHWNYWSDASATITICYFVYIEIAFFEGIWERPPVKCDAHMHTVTRTPSVKPSVKIIWTKKIIPIWQIYEKKTCSQRKLHKVNVWAETYWFFAGKTKCFSAFCCCNYSSGIHLLLVLWCSEQLKSVWIRQWLSKWFVCTKNDILFARTEKHVAAATVYICNWYLFSCCCYCAVQSSPFFINWWNRKHHVNCFDWVVCIKRFWLGFL